METHLAYCSACDREVEVTLKPGYTAEPGTPIPPEAMICLAYGDACTGALCPLFGVPSEQMKADLDRSQLRTEP
ncbi:MAG TPA: hypothetical protein VMM12_04175 [Longimicrobiales bacterium]|nr:hypothetical protein [Longimicrobiales bacterium]